MVTTNTLKKMLASSKGMKAMAMCMMGLSANMASAQEVNMDLLVHSYLSAQQNGYNTTQEAANSSDWSYGANVYRARIVGDMKITDKDYIFMETELNASVGLNGNKEATFRLLDIQYDHTFSKALTLSAGKMLVSHNRNGLQTASTLMANDFTYYQYPFNMSENDPLQNDCGRDVGVNASGAFGKEDKITYRLGAFAGRREFEGKESAPLRVVGRMTYNFLDADKYSGTNLGDGKTSTIGAGFDTQGTYVGYGADYYLDYPLSSSCQLTLNTAYAHHTGGSAESSYSFASMVPEQNIYFGELGFYFPGSKIQPWVKYERQDLCCADSDTDVYGAGINYFFNGYRTNVRLSWQGMNKDMALLDGTRGKKMYHQIWLQLQLCTF